MKKILILLLPLFFGMSLLTFGQGSGTPILPFNEGKVLSEDDISFLRLIKGEAGEPSSRGGVKGSTSVENTVFSVGSVLSKADAVIINKAIEVNMKKNEKNITKDAKAPEELARGAAGGYCGYCCYYYYYDYYCNCYRYQWYYCCACY